MPNLRRTFSFTIAALAGSLVTASLAVEPDQRPSIRQATFARGESTLPQTIEFGRRAPEIGDQIDQAVSVELRLSTALRRGNTIAEKSATTVRNAQQRTLTTTEIAAGRATGVIVRFAAATKQVHRAADDGEPSAQTTPAPAQVPQPVADKTYHCRRDPGNDGRLIITDSEGNIPPLVEYEIVAQTMETVGRPNPFTEFLAGRRVQVGETVALPNAVADRLFGMGDDFGQVQRFHLTLKSVEMKDNLPSAVFHANVEAASSDSSQMRLQVEGLLEVDIETCRALRTELSGPVAMSESRGSYSTAYQLLGTGKLTMSIASTYRDATR